MEKRRFFYNIFLWWSVIGMSIWVGGTIFSMSVVVPMWSDNPPGSVHFFFGQTSFNKYIWNFFGPPFMALRNLPQLVTLALGWYLRPQRKYLLVAVICTLFGVIYTLTYVYPINDILMAKAGGDQPAEAIQSMVNRWIFADRIRFIVMFTGYIFLLKAFRVPPVLNLEKK
jgi:Domain of unknown function (DUF1772)